MTCQSESVGGFWFFFWWSFSLNYYCRVTSGHRAGRTYLISKISWVSIRLKSWENWTLAARAAIHNIFSPQKHIINVRTGWQYHIFDQISWYQYWHLVQNLNTMRFLINNHPSHVRKITSIHCDRAFKTRRRQIITITKQLHSQIITDRFVGF